MRDTLNHVPREIKIANMLNERGLSVSVKRLQNEVGHVVIYEIVVDNEIYNVVKQALLDMSLVVKNEEKLGSDYIKIRLF